MRKILFLFLAVTLCILSGCGKSDELASLSKQCGIELVGGTIESVNDTHGGFHNDGCKQVVIQCSDDSITEEMETNEHWRKLPLTDNLSEFLYKPYDDSLEIPEIENGYYYFIDRHSESNNPYDDTDLLDRHSYNFTIAIFDTDTNSLYFVEYDT